jgi:hypothetical protein
VAAEMAGPLLSAVVVATKGGLRRIAGRQWVDATETGDLVRTLGPSLANGAAESAAQPGPVASKIPNRSTVFIFLQQSRWTSDGPTALEIADAPKGCTAVWEPTMWETQRRLRIEIPGRAEGFRGLLVPAMKALRAELGRDGARAFVSHASVSPYPVYGAGDVQEIGYLPENVGIAVPALTSDPVVTLADRAALGENTARQMADRPQSESRPAASERVLPGVRNVRELGYEVAVVGAGTGGVVAAIASGREGAKTGAFDPLAFVGGVGTGGGIHQYYWGIANGLQAEIDERVRAVTPLFATPKQWGEPRFHPEAKKAVLEEMLTEAGVELHLGTMVARVEREGRRVKAAVMTSPEGPLRLVADCWVDGTGDGDLADLAGCRSELGREIDGLPHAYTQSAAWMGRVEGELVCRHNLNHDSGYVDPTDSEDLTRARLEGVAQHFSERYDAVARPLGISPHLGLRQGRHIETDHILSLDDIVEHREFSDSVGITGCDCDAHAVDYEFESDEAVLYVWAFGMRRLGAQFHLPYRMLLPRGIDNLWIGSRAVGVSNEAHMFLRMQRHMQRVGEVSGIAAAMAAGGNVTSRQLDVDSLRVRLRETGALSFPDEGAPSFGKQSLRGRFPDPLADLPEREAINRCLEEVKTLREEPVVYQGRTAGVDPMVPAEAHVAEGTNTNPTWYESTKAAGPAMWRLYRAGPAEVGREVLDLLSSDDDELVWRGTLILAGWGDSAAEPRLIRAIDSREEGREFERTVDAPWQRHNIKILPRWYVAAALLRMCGTARCLDSLAALSASDGLPLNGRTIVALTCERLAARGAVPAEATGRVGEILDCLLASDPPHVVGKPTRNPLHWRDPYSGKSFKSSRPFSPDVREDYTWQLHYAVGRARKALGWDVQDEAYRFATDRRALVRRAFERIGVTAAKP